MYWLKVITSKPNALVAYSTTGPYDTVISQLADSVFRISVVVGCYPDSTEVNSVDKVNQLLDKHRIPKEGWV